ncbi:MAG: hypothetical protein ACRCZF_21490 [Gemmataceae bacterium]
MAAHIPPFESRSKQELIALCDRLHGDDPDGVKECIAFLEAETVWMWHGRARAMIARRLKHHSLTRVQRERVVRAVLRRLVDGRFSEGFKDQLRLVLRLDAEQAFSVARGLPANAPEYVRRYAAWILARAEVPALPIPGTAPPVDGR